MSPSVAGNCPRFSPNQGGLVEQRLVFDGLVFDDSRALAVANPTTIALRTAKAHRAKLS